MLLTSTIFISTVVASSIEMPTFSEWKKTHGRAYGSAAEEARRAAIYAENVVYYQTRDANEPAATFGPDIYADIPMKQFIEKRAGFQKDHPSLQTSSSSNIDVGNTTTMAAVTIDWRDPSKNPKKVVAVTAVKNQGAYGTCWSFGASGCLEGMAVIQQGQPLVALSEQEFIDCCKPCQGSGPQTTWNYLINNTHGKPFECALKTGKTVNGSKIVTGKANIASYVAVGNASVANQDDILKMLIKYGPGNIGVDATCLFGYKKGVISNCTGKSVDHATLLVGAGSQPPTPTATAALVVKGANMPYWIVKNSWGPGFGEEGYYRMERNKGQCDFHGAAFPIAA
eukprot:gene770-5307_t